MAIGAGWAEGSFVDAAWTVPAWAQSAASATISGATTLTQSQIVAGSQQIIVTLADATWVASGATFNAQRQNIIDGITASVTSTNGWNNEVRDNLDVTAVERSSDTVVIVTLSAQAGISITADETITITIPASATSLSDPLVGIPQITLSASSSIGGEGPFETEEDWFAYRRRQWLAYHRPRVF